MAPPRLATFAVGGSTRYGAVADGGIIDLTAPFGKQYPTLREAVAAGALMKLTEAAARRSPDHAHAALVRRSRNAAGSPARLGAARLRGRSGPDRRQGRPAYCRECRAGSH